MSEEQLQDDVLFYDIEGNPVTALSNVTNWTVAFGMNKQSGEYQPEKPFMSVSATRLPGQTDEQVKLQAQAQMDYLKKMVYRNTPGGYAPPAPQQTSKPAAVQSAPSEGGPEWDALGQSTNDSKPRIVNFVSAKEREPGMRYRIEVDEYAIEGDKIHFYGPNSKYAKFSTYTDRATFRTSFNEWVPKDTEGKREPLPGGKAILTIDVLEKMAGNYHDQDVIAVERPAA